MKSGGICISLMALVGLFSQLSLFLQETLSLHIGSDDVFQYSSIVSFYFLFDLKYMEVLGEVVDFPIAHRVDQGSLSNSISPYETVFLALD